MLFFLLLASYQLALMLLVSNGFEVILVQSYSVVFSFFLMLLFRARHHRRSRYDEFTPELVEQLDMVIAAATASRCLSSESDDYFRRPTSSHGHRYPESTNNKKNPPSHDIHDSKLYRITKRRRQPARGSRRSRNDSESSHKSRT